jgi:CMP-N-acetylneuraminic acid synthetase
MWTVFKAVGSRVFDRVVVSSESREVETVLNHYGFGEFFVERPQNLATSEITNKDVLAWHLQHDMSDTEDEDNIIVLHPTSPFRDVDKIARAVEILDSSSAETVASVHLPKTKRQPILKGVCDYDRLNQTGFMRAIDLASKAAQHGFTYYDAGLYGCKKSYFDKTKSYHGEHSVFVANDHIESLDIDEPIDLALAQSIVAAGLAKLNISEDNSCPE